MNAETTPWAKRIRLLGREIATEVAAGGTYGDPSSQDLGWRLWEGVTLRGEERLRDGGSPVFWSYTTTLALRTDGEIVTFQTKEGRQSPNIPMLHGVDPASDKDLLYPDVVRWEEEPQIEEAEIRTIIDTFRVPSEYAEPLGGGLTSALEDLRSKGQSPEPLGQAPVQTPPPQEKTGFWRRVFGST